MYTKSSLQAESAIHTNYIRPLYGRKIANIRKANGEQNVWFGAGQKAAVKPHWHPLQNAVLKLSKYEAVFKVCGRFFEYFAEGPVSESQMWAAFTHATAYMLNSLQELSLIFRKMIDPKCMACGAHRTAETVRTQFPEVEKLISINKRI